MKWATRELSPMCAEISVDLSSRKDVFSALLISDAHWDHPLCVRSLYDKAIAQAVANNSPILYNGDTLCLMQSPTDRRMTKGKTRTEHEEPDYFRAIAVDFVEQHKRAARNIALLGYGNHETAPLKHYSVDPVKMLADQFERITKHRPIVGGYRGWVKFRFTRQGRDCINGVLKCYYFHGAGGGGPVTKGVIGTARRNAFIDGADIVWTGHVHEKWMLDTPVISCNREGRESVKPRWHLCTPGFKDEFGGESLGWHVERGAPPKPTGAAWLRVYYEGEGVQYELTWA